MRLPFFLKSKAYFQLFDGVPLGKLSPCVVVHIPQFIPQFREMTAQFPQFFQRLQRTAPAGHTAEYIIQTIPIKTAFPTIGKTVRFGHVPVYKRITVFLDTPGFVCGNPDVLDYRVVLLQLAQIPIDDSGFQHPGTPTGVGSCPAHTAVSVQIGIFSFWCILVKVVFKGFRCFQTGDRSGDILLQSVNVVIHPVKFDAGIAEQDDIDRHPFFQHPQKHGSGIFST